MLLRPRQSKRVDNVCDGRHSTDNCLLPQLWSVIFTFEFKLYAVKLNQHIQNIWVIAIVHALLCTLRCRLRQRIARIHV